MIRYVIKVLEPKRDYMLDFVDITLDGCKSQADKYLSQCPRGTDYMFISTRYTYDRKTIYSPKGENYEIT